MGWLIIPGGYSIRGGVVAILCGILGEERVGKAFFSHRVPELAFELRDMLGLNDEEFKSVVHFVGDKAKDQAM